jgi:hypothetical protein
MRSTVPGMLLGLAILGASGAADPVEVIIEVDAGPHERREAPVVFRLPESLAKEQAFVLKSPKGEPLDVQRIPSATAEVAWIVRDLPAGAQRRYRLTAGANPPAASRTMTCIDDGRGLVLTRNGRPVLRYNHTVVESPAGIDPDYRRGGQIHPLFTPSGLIVTDDFPPDHAHQHGVFFAWVNTTYNGHDLDFWNQKKKTGRVRPVTVLETTGGPVFSQFSVKLRHEDITNAADPAPVLDEVLTVRAYNLADRHLVDYESRQACAGPKPLEMNKYHYGGFGVRGHRAWLDPTAKGDDPPDPARCGQSDFLTSEGKRRADGNHTRPRWTDLSGNIGDRSGGATVLDHPGNFRFPQPVRLHPNKPYFCFAPMVPAAFTIEPGKPYVSRYRLDVHDGRPDPAAIERLWHDYTEPPQARVVE